MYSSKLDAMWETIATHPALSTALQLALLALVALVSYALGSRVLLKVVSSAAQRSAAKWDDALMKHRVFDRLAQMLPAMIIHRGIGLVPTLSAGVLTVVRNVSIAFILVSIARSISGALWAANERYELTPRARSRPIKGYIQIAQIVVFSITAFLIVAVLIERSPLLMLSGLGAMTAVLMVVFKDTILSLVASVQLASNDMLRVGDWIEMPLLGADGDVIDIALHTVKVQNWDKTITTIPTWRLIGESFKNWRGMQEFGARRIKRALHLDLSTARFLTDKEIDELSRFALLRKHIETKRAELRAWNANLGSDSATVNARRLTNIGCFRAYAEAYLRSHPGIDVEKTLMVRQLQAASEGLPIEIYCFSNDIRWVAYEGIQSDIFDHLIAILPEFSLRLFQQPAGSDLQKLTSASAAPRA